MDITLNIKITGLECLADGMMALANAWTAANGAIGPNIKTTTGMTISGTNEAPAQTAAPMYVQPAQMPIQAHTPVQQVQTSAPTYTLDDLCKAAMPLMDAGRQQELMNLVANFGVTSLPELPTERFGEFATALRAMGAQI